MRKIQSNLSCFGPLWWYKTFNEIKSRRFQNILCLANYFAVPDFFLHLLSTGIPELLYAQFNNLIGCLDDFNYIRSEACAVLIVTIFWSSVQHTCIYTCSMVDGRWPMVNGQWSMVEKTSILVYLCLQDRCRKIYHDRENWNGQSILHFMNKRKESDEPDTILFLLCFLCDSDHRPCHFSFLKHLTNADEEKMKYAKISFIFLWLYVF